MKNILCLFVLLFPLYIHAQKTAPKPLFRDPVYDGAADPVVTWNAKEKKWFMFYTNRRANDANAKGVSWCHGTRIGIAESVNGRNWTYRDTANINYRPDSGYTFWAPEVMEHEGIYHMYLTYVPGIFNDWGHPRHIVHLTSRDLLNWDYQSVLKLSSDKVIDACVTRLPDGNWRMWYNDEPTGKSIYYADSRDLYNWTDKGQAISDHRGEGPKVFFWKGKYRMIVDNWAGMSIYSSADLVNWQRQPKRILEEPGTGPEDAAIGGHADVLVNNGRAYVFYFIHPGRTKINQAPDDSYNSRRTLIQLTELEIKDDIITCNRNNPVQIDLKRP
jgi:hypothetical protein